MIALIFIYEMRKKLIRKENYCLDMKVYEHIKRQFIVDLKDINFFYVNFFWE
jgi:hypothetical protein